MFIISSLGGGGWQGLFYLPREENISAREENIFSSRAKKKGSAASLMQWAADVITVPGSVATEGVGGKRMGRGRQHRGGGSMREPPQLLVGSFSGRAAPLPCGYFDGFLWACRQFTWHHILCGSRCVCRYRMSAPISNETVLCFFWPQLISLLLNSSRCAPWHHVKMGVDDLSMMPCGGIRSRVPDRWRRQRSKASPSMD